MNFYIAEKDDSLGVVYTSIPSHLSRMIEILVEEESSVKGIVNRVFIEYLRKDNLNCVTDFVLLPYMNPYN